MRALVVIVVLVASVHAEPLPPPKPPTEWHLLGTRVSYGALEIEGMPMTTASIGVSIDRPLYGQWRVLGEYEHLWIGPRDWEMLEDSGVGALPDSGHRVHAGVRRRVAEHYWAYGRFGVFFDAELGGGAMLVDHRPSGTIAMPHAFVGARMGMSLVWDQQRWDYEIVLRGLVMQDHPDRPGVLFGIGLVWGD